MIINNGTIREAFQSFNTVFNKAFQEMEAQYPRVAMEVPSETRDESYAWLGAVPSMREWIGDREIKNLSAYGYTIRNKDFEMTVSVPRNDLEDDCIGVYKPMFQDLAYSARRHPDKDTFEALATLLQLDPSATMEDIYKAVAALLEGQEALKLKADACQFEVVRMKADGVVEEALRAGKVLPFQRDLAFQSAINDMDGFTLWLKSAPQVVPYGEVCCGGLDQAKHRRARAHELMGLSAEDVAKYGNI